MNVLHIVNWYPNIYNKFEAQFIKEHINSLDISVKQKVWHVQVRDGNNLFKLSKKFHPSELNYILISTKIKTSIIRELLTLMLLFFVSIKEYKKGYDVTNFHIAYPLVRYPKVIKKLFQNKLVISEHWSAYHFGFNIKNPDKKRKIQQIFYHNIPIIVVSRALENDILEFAPEKTFETFILPNIVQKELFYYKPKNKEKEIKFISISNWAPIKRPFLFLEAFKQLNSDSTFTNFHVTIVGQGTQLDEMKKFVTNNKLDKQFTFTGNIPKENVAENIRNSDYLLHPSEYETFSVVCAESLCCGVPVIASKVGGIPEVVKDGVDGILIQNRQKEWNETILNCMKLNFDFKSEAIYNQAKNRFYASKIGDQYLYILQSIVEND